MPVLPTPSVVILPNTTRSTALVFDEDDRVDGQIPYQRFTIVAWRVEEGVRALPILAPWPADNQWVWIEERDPDSDVPRRYVDTSLDGMVCDTLGELCAYVAAELKRRGPRCEVG